VLILSEELKIVLDWKQKLNHPCIMQVYEVIADCQSIHIVSEYYEGGELFE
jgi:serine/threonine protein kinase